MIKLQSNPTPVGNSHSALISTQIKKKTTEKFSNGPSRSKIRQDKALHEAIKAAHYNLILQENCDNNKDLKRLKEEHYKLHNFIKNFINKE